jgi:hypothetical protein
MEMIDTAGSLVFAAVIFMIWTVLYKENPLYKIISNISVGLALAFWLKGGLDSIAKDVVSPAIFQANVARMVVLALGLMMFFRYYKQFSFISKWPIAILSGVGTAIAVKGAIPSMILSQIKSGNFAGPDLYTNLMNIVLWVGIISTLVYFIFSFQRGRVIGTISRIGQVYMMISFGVVFGQSIYGSSVMVQMTYLLNYPGYYVTIFGILGLIAWVLYNRSRTPKPAIETPKEQN